MIGVDAWALVVAAVALAASGVIGWKANGLSRRLVEIEKARAGREDEAIRSADLHVLWRFRPVADDELAPRQRIAQWEGSPHYHDSLVVENRGGHPARHVRVTVGGELVGATPEIAPTQSVVVDEGEAHSERPSGQSEFVVDFEDGRGHQQVVRIASPQEIS
jgi:hypothetical protein